MHESKQCFSSFIMHVVALKLIAFMSTLAASILSRSATVTFDNHQLFHLKNLLPFILYSLFNFFVQKALLFKILCLSSPTCIASLGTSFSSVFAVFPTYLNLRS